MASVQCLKAESIAKDYSLLVKLCNEYGCIPKNGALWLSCIKI